MRIASISATSADSGRARRTAAASSACQKTGSRLIEVWWPAIVIERLTGPWNPSAGAAITSPACGSLGVEQRSQLFDDRPAELFDIHDRHGARVIARDVVADADRDEFDGRLALDPADHLAQV